MKTMSSVPSQPKECHPFDWQGAQLCAPTVLIFLSLVSVCAFGEPLCINQARLGEITGDVGLLSQGAANWIDPHEGLPIESGDRLRTGEDGHVNLLLSENVFWVLEPESEIVLERIDANSGRANLSSGTLMGRIDSLRAASMAQHWELDSPAAVLVIRGTEFVFVVTQGVGSRLGVFEGRVEVQPAETAEGPQTPLFIDSNHEMLAMRGKPLKTLEKFSPTMRSLLAKRRALRLSHQHAQAVWSPFTPTVRTQLRRNFVAPPSVKHKVRRPLVGGRRRHPAGASEAP
jgi:hypothetical protein